MAGFCLYELQETIEYKISDNCKKKHFYTLSFILNAVRN